MVDWVSFGYGLPVGALLGYLIGTWLYTRRLGDIATSISDQRERVREWRHE